MKQGYTVPELDALLNSIEGLDWHVYNRKIDERGCIIIDGEIVVLKENVERALRFAVPRYYVTDEPDFDLTMYRQIIADRMDYDHYFKVTVESSELEEINSKVRSILSALNKK